jgi:flavodoxin
MKALILYDSEYGNTEHIAQVIARTLNEYGDVDVLRVDQAHPTTIDDVDLLILGCPTQRWQLSPRMKAFLARVPDDTLAGIMVACFDTRLNHPAWMTGSASKSLVRSIRHIGCAAVVDRESFLVEGMEGPLAPGELARAQNWAHHLRHEAERAQNAPLVV